MTAVLLAALRLHGVIDQVDAGWAWVEWEGRDFGYVAADLLPPGAGEGDAIVLRLRRGRSEAVTTADPLPLEVPRHTVVKASIHRARPQRAASRRSHVGDP